MTFPSEMHIDYVRVYQREGHTNIGCDPPDYPTADYIANHAPAYNNPNLTGWADAGYTKPRNSLVCLLQVVPFVDYANIARSMMDVNRKLIFIILFLDFPYSLLSRLD